MRKKIIVVGSGICGLTAAYRLRQKGFEPIVVEREARPGGRTKTDYQDGYVNDLGGSLLASTYREALSLADELGLRELREPFGGALQLMIGGRTYSLEMAHAFRSILRAPYLSLGAKLRLVRLVPKLLMYWGRLNLHDLSGVAALDTESAEAFCLRTVGQEAYDVLLNPLTRAMYGHDGSEISVVELLWMVRTFAACSAVAFRGGMGTFVEALRRDTQVLTGHEVLRVDGRPDRVEVRVRSASVESVLEADFCAIASDGKDLETIHGHALTGRQNEFLQALCYNPLSLIYFKLKERPKDVGFIVELTREQDPEVGAFAWYHLWGQTKTPKDKGALIFLGTNDWQFRVEHLPVEERIAEARRYAIKYYPFLEELEEGVDVAPWPRGTIVGRVGHYRRLQGFVADIDPTSRVQYGGDYMSQSSIGAAVATGNDLASRMEAAATPIQRTASP